MRDGKRTLTKDYKLGESRTSNEFFRPKEGRNYSMARPFDREGITHDQSPDGSISVSLDREGELGFIYDETRANRPERTLG